jgi:hypothetical protein
MASPSNEIFRIKNADDVYSLPETDEMLSSFDERPNINKDTLIHLLKGKPVVDLSDGEYIHWFQLDDDALNYLKELN